MQNGTKEMCLTTQDLKILEINKNGKRIKDATDKEINEVTIYCVALLPIIHLPEKSLLNVINDFLREAMPMTPLMEIKQAFIMAVAKQIDYNGIEFEKCYQFTPALISGVYNSYRNYLQKVLLKKMQYDNELKAKKMDEERNKPKSKEEMFLMSKRSILNIYKNNTFERIKKVDDFGFVNMRFINKIGLFQFTEEDEQKVRNLTQIYFQNKHENSSKKLHDFFKQIIIDSSDEKLEYNIVYNEYLLGLFFYNLKQMDVDLQVLDEMIEDRKEFYI